MANSAVSASQRGGGPLGGVENSLKALSVQQLKRLLNDETEFEEYFAMEAPIVKEKQELVQQIKHANISYAQKNLADEIALDELVQEVQDLRKVVQERQESLRPKVEQVHMALQEDPRAPVIEMMQQAAGDAESACREIIDAGGGGDWNNFVSELTLKKKVQHYRQQLIERLENTQPA